MRKSTLLLAAALLGAGTSAVAADDMKMDMKMDMKSMDANGDGMISKEEFMKFHEAMFDKMKKNKAGMVDVKELEMMHHKMEMMHKDDMKTHDMKTHDMKK